MPILLNRGLNPLILYIREDLAYLSRLSIVQIKVQKVAQTNESYYSGYDRQMRKFLLLEKIVGLESRGGPDQHHECLVSPSQRFESQISIIKLSKISVV